MEMKEEERWAYSLNKSGGGAETTAETSAKAVAQNLMNATRWRQLVAQRKDRHERTMYDLDATVQDGQRTSQAEVALRNCGSDSSADTGSAKVSLDKRPRRNRWWCTFANYAHTILCKPVDSNEAWYKTWLGVVAFAYLYNLISVIGRFSFSQLDERFRLFWMTFNYLTDIVYFFDVHVILRLVYLHHGLPINDRQLLFRHNVKTKEFLCSVAATVPLDHLLGMFSFAISSYVVTLSRMNRLLLYRRLIQFVNFAETETRRPNLFRAVQLMVTVYVIFHWATCFYYLISIAYGLESDSWVYNSERIHDVTYDCSNSSCWQPAEALGSNKCKIIEYPALLKHYLLSFYWAALMLISVGEQPFPIYIGQYIFTIGNIIAGTLILAALIGNVRIVVAGMNQQRITFLKRLDAVKNYMEMRHIDPKLRQRTVSWFNYVWEQKHTVDEDTVMEMLPMNLRTLVAIDLHISTLRKAQLFKDCDPGLLADMVTKLKLQVFSPGDYICRKGEIGKDMYIVRNGVLNVVAEDGVTVFVTLSEGCVFGELSILDIPGNKNGNRRTTSVRSVGFSELFVLTKNDLFESLENYPDARRLLLEKGKDILRKDKLLIETDTQDKDTLHYVEEEYEYESLNRLNYNFMTIKCRLAELNVKVKRDCDLTEQRIIALEEKCKANFCTLRHTLA